MNNKKENININPQKEQTNEQKLNERKSSSQSKIIINFQEEIDEDNELLDLLKSTCCLKEREEKDFNKSNADKKNDNVIEKNDIKQKNIIGNINIIKSKSIQRLPYSKSRDIFCPHIKFSLKHNNNINNNTRNDTSSTTEVTHDSIYRAKSQSKLCDNKNQELNNFMIKGKNNIFPFNKISIDNPIIGNLRHKIQSDGNLILPKLDNGFTMNSMGKLKSLKCSDIKIKQKFRK